MKIEVINGIATVDRYIWKVKKDIDLNILVLKI